MNTDTPELEPLIGAKRVRSILDVPDRTFRRWLAGGRFPAADVRIGRALRWRTSTVERFIANGGVLK